MDLRRLVPVAGIAGAIALASVMTASADNGTVSPAFVVCAMAHDDGVNDFDACMAEAEKMTPVELEALAADLAREGG